jgi:hypothetical protein
MGETKAGSSGVWECRRLSAEQAERMGLGEVLSLPHEITNELEPDVGGGIADGRRTSGG